MPLKGIQEGLCSGHTKHTGPDAHPPVPPTLPPLKHQRVPFGLPWVPSWVSPPPSWICPSTQEFRHLQALCSPTSWPLTILVPHVTQQVTAVTVTQRDHNREDGSSPIAHRAGNAEMTPHTTPRTLPEPEVPRKGALTACVLVSAGLVSKVPSRPLPKLTGPGRHGQKCHHPEVSVHPQVSSQSPGVDGWRESLGSLI